MLSKTEEQNNESEYGLFVNVKIGLGDIAKKIYIIFHIIRYRSLLNIFITFFKQRAVEKRFKFNHCIFNFII